MRIAARASALVLLLACQAASQNDLRDRPESMTETAHVDAFLKTWLIDENWAESVKFLHSRFHAQDEMRAPSASASQQPRALRFARSCEGAPLRCSTLSECIEPLDTASGGKPYDLERLTVNAEMIRDNPHLADLEGKQIIHVSFMLKGCRLGVSVLIDPSVEAMGRVRSIFYLAG